MGYAPNLVLNAVTENTTSAATILGAFHSKLAMQVTLPETVVGGTVALQGSLNGTDFDTDNPLASFVVGEGEGVDVNGAIKYSVDKPVYAYRCVLSDYSGSGSVTAVVGVDARG